VKRQDPATSAVRAGVATDAHHGAVIPPIHLSSTFGFEGFGEKRAYDYTRTGNPTRDCLGAAIAELERGTGAVITSTGMSAVLVTLHLVPAGALVLAPFDCYGGTYRLLNALAAKRMLEVAYVDFRNDRQLGTALARRPAMVWIETPSNPLLRITDIAAVARRAHAAGAVVVADNTFLSPALQRPLELGADLVVHSTTKYINGHSDVVGGAVVASDASVAEELAWWANCLGITGAPFDSFLTLRGLRTLHARMRLHLENAEAVVATLGAHAAVRRVHYPGLPAHPGHGIAARQQAGFGAMVSFELAGGVAAVRAFVESVRCFTLAESLGGVESLVAHPATMTHASMDAEARAAAGITDSLVRLSVGIEAAADLTADLSRCLDEALRTTGDGCSEPPARLHVVS